MANLVAGRLPAPGRSVVSTRYTYRRPYRRRLRRRRGGEAWIMRSLAASVVVIAMTALLHAVPLAGAPQALASWIVGADPPSAGPHTAASARPVSGYVAGQPTPTPLPLPVLEPARP
jgi:hypothetical protein